MRHGTGLIAALSLTLMGWQVAAATAAVPDIRHEGASSLADQVAPVTCRDDCYEPRYYEPRYYGPPVNPYPAPAYRYGPPPALLYTPPPVLLVPERPVSCGQFRYWNGMRCADARFEPPYIGPKW